MFVIYWILVGMDSGHDMIDVPMDCPMLRSDWVGCLPCLFTRGRGSLYKKRIHSLEIEIKLKVQG